MQQKIKETVIKENIEAKAMIKPFAKRGLLSRSDGVTMVGHDQAPQWCSYGSSQPGPQMKPWHYVDQEAWQWFGFDQAPK